LVHRSVDPAWFAGGDIFRSRVSAAIGAIAGAVPVRVGAISLQVAAQVHAAVAVRQASLPVSIFFGGAAVPVRWAINVVPGFGIPVDPDSAKVWVVETKIQPSRPSAIIRPRATTRTPTCVARAVYGVARSRHTATPRCVAACRAAHAHVIGPPTIGRLARLRSVRLATQVSVLATTGITGSTRLGGAACVQAQSE
jgi:hypothetical protein